VIRIDCANIEPTDRGFMAELARAVGGADRDLLGRMAGMASRVILALDTYEAFRISDPWIRQSLLPGLPANVRAVIVGREPPSIAWFGSLGWSGALSVLDLGPLDEQNAIQLLRASGLSAAAAAGVNRVARGYPLALRVAAAGRVDPTLHEAGAPRALEELAARYLEQADDTTRLVLEAASVVRRVTPSLLAAMLPEAAPRDALERLQALPFVRSAPDGLVIHPTLREAIATRLNTKDRALHLRYRQAAWRLLREEVRGAPVSDLWRYTADMLYLIENPIVREAFFPAAGQLYAVEPALSTDRAAVLETIARHEASESAAIAHAWLERAPATFRVVRDREGVVAGFYQVFEVKAFAGRAWPDDPVTTRWRGHLRDDPVRPGDLVLCSRRMLDRERGEAPGPLQAAVFLDVKRLYMELRPRLRRIYWGAYNALDFLPALGPLGFVAVPAADGLVDGRPFRTLMLDFGPGSVDEWLARVAAAELGLNQEDLLDVSARELVIGDDRVPLTRLEFDLLRYLILREGKAVPRTDLLADVWGYSYAGDSNVIEVAVRSLRRKLGERSGSLETVRGIGYRYRRG
ncbi:MAG TPA: winged helix-turn-helix domain-containing protein, partial [Candidatus Limnocylindria bacterium]|nr:winged helix-turn-helix domain-containing protein [Candidatus Limnocylindria bacterium]